MQATLSIAIAGSALAGCSSVASDAPSTPLETELPSLLPYVECMQDRGWDLQYHEEDGGFQAPGAPPGQEEQYNEDDEYCTEEFWPPDSRALTADEWLIVYDALLEQRDCLIAEGASLTEVPPSATVFVEDAMAGNQWSPTIELLEQIGGKAFMPFLQACPDPTFFAAAEE